MHSPLENVDNISAVFTGRFVTAGQGKYDMVGYGSIGLILILYSPIGARCPTY